MKNDMRQVSVIGTATASEDEYRLAEQVGRLLGESKAIVVCGGGSGVMEAVCKGAQEAGGITVGILPGTESGNRYHTVSIPTGLGGARNLLVVRSGESVIAIGGRYGTLSEIAYAKKLGLKVIGLNTWEARDGSGKSLEIIPAGTAREAVSLALE